MSLHRAGLVGGGPVVGAGPRAAPPTLGLVFALHGLLPVAQLQAPPFPIAGVAPWSRRGELRLDLGWVYVGVEGGHGGEHHAHDDQQRGEQDVLCPLWSRGRKKGGGGGGGENVSYANVYATVLSYTAHMDKDLKLFIFLSVILYCRINSKFKGDIFYHQV